MSDINAVIRRLKKSAEYETSKWGCNVTPDAEVRLDAAIGRAVKRLSEDNSLGEFEISRAETNLRKWMQESVAHSRRKKRTEISSTILEGSFKPLRAAMWPFD